MQLKSILNRVQKHPSFVYQTVRLVEHQRLSIEVRIRPRAGTRARCSQCRRPAPGYDTQAVRRFDFVPLWHIPVVFLYAMRRVSCPRCGVRVEALPWATGKHRLTDAYAWFLAGWAKRLSWQEVAAAFPTSWDTVHRAVRMAVDWGLAHRDLTNIEAIGVDELSRRRGQRYLTLVYQIDGHCKRLLWVGRERKAATLESFFDWFGAARSAALYFVCSDMWKPYLKVVAERAQQAVQVLDRFHIMSHFSQAIDEVRAAEARKLAAGGPGAGAQAQPLAPAQASGESHRRAAGTACGAGASQPAHGSRLPAQGGLPIAVGLRVAVLGGAVSRPLVHSGDAFAARTDEGGGAHGALAPRPDPELVPSQGAVLQWRCRRLQREGQSGHQTGVRVPHLRSTGSRFVSHTWRPARTRTHPQILLTRPFCQRITARERGGVMNANRARMARMLDRRPGSASLVRLKTEARCPRGAIQRSRRLDR